MMNSALMRAGVVIGSMIIYVQPCHGQQTLDLQPVRPTAFSDALMDKPEAKANMSSPKVDIYKAVEKKSFSGQAGELVFRAIDLMGVKYRFGGTSAETGLDCSGFVGLVFKESIGAKLPRTSNELSKIGKMISLKDLKIGDLVFYNTLKSRFSHVGIYIGDDRFIHSPSSGGSVRMESMREGYWKSRFSGGRRVIDAF